MGAMLTSLLALARKVPAWAWVVIAALAWGGIQRHRAAAAGAELRQHDAEVAAETLKASQAAQTETARRLAAQQGITDEAQARARTAGLAAAGARAAADRLRVQLAAAASSAAAGNPTASAGGQAAVLADVLSQCAGRLQVVAAVADDAINRGRACEAAYTSLTPPKGTP